MHYKWIRLVATLVVLWSGVSRGEGHLPPRMHELALRSVELVYREEFDRAMETAKQLVRENPSHPAGYFFCAVVIDSWTGCFQSSRRENEFYRYCELAIERGEALLSREPRNAWARFFVGGTEGLKGNYESRYERWITAFRNGWKGVSILLDIQRTRPQMRDVNYGIGTYNYWRSAMTRVMFWMPGVEDKREDGIRRLLDALNNGVYTREASAANLIDIYVDAGEYGKALGLADSMMALYPGALRFWWGKAEALFGLGRYDLARENFKGILAKIESQQRNNHYGSVLCHYWLAKIHLAQGRYEQCVSSCEKITRYSLSEQTGRRLGKYLNEATELKRRAAARR